MIKERKRKGQQPPAGYISWVPRRAKWRAGETTEQIAGERRTHREFERRGMQTQAHISSIHHFQRAAERLGEDDERKDVWRVHDAIHKIITFTGVENELDRTELLQRLRGVAQLEAVHYGYFVGATHSRYTHAGGTMHLAGRIARQLKLPQKQQQLLRLAGLLHDVGHPIFSHGAEPILKKVLGRDHDELAEEMMRKHEVPALLAKHNIDFEEVLKLTRGEGLGEIVTEFADRMDYLQRDGHGVGVKNDIKKGLKLTIEEVIRNLKIHEGKVCIISKGEKALKQFANYRNLFYSQIYFLPTSMLTRHLLSRMLNKAISKGTLSVADLFEKPERDVMRKIQETDMPEAEHIGPALANLHFTQVFAASFDQVKQRFRKNIENKGIQHRLRNALRKAGLKDHEFFVGVTPRFEKTINYRVLKPDGNLEEKQYTPRTPEEDKHIFVGALDEKINIAKRAVTPLMRFLVRRQHGFKQPWIFGGTEKV